MKYSSISGRSGPAGVFVMNKNKIGIELDSIPYLSIYFCYSDISLQYFLCILQLGLALIAGYAIAAICHAGIRLRAAFEVIWAGVRGARCRRTIGNTSTSIYWLTCCCTNTIAGRTVRASRHICMDTAIYRTAGIPCADISVIALRVIGSVRAGSCSRIAAISCAIYFVVAVLRCASYTTTEV